VVVVAGIGRVGWRHWRIPLLAQAGGTAAATAVATVVATVAAVAMALAPMGVENSTESSTADLTTGEEVYSNPTTVLVQGQPIYHRLFAPTIHLPPNPRRPLRSNSFSWTSLGS